MILEASDRTPSVSCTDPRETIISDTGCCTLQQQQQQQQQQQRHQWIENQRQMSKF